MVHLPFFIWIIPAEKLREENELMAMEFYQAEGAIEFDFETSLWEDEDTRTFHENLIDLRTMVPAVSMIDFFIYISCDFVEFYQTDGAIEFEFENLTVGKCIH